MSPIVLVLLLNQSKFSFFTNEKSVDLKENQLSIVRSENFETIEEAYVELKLIIHELVPIERYNHFILDSTADEYYSFPFQNLKTSDLKFTADSAIVQMLSTTKTPLIIENLNNLPMVIRDEKEILKLLDVQAFIPIMTEEYLRGWLALSFGQKNGNEIRKYIEKISPSISKTTKQIERLIHQIELEKRVKDMNVLTRIVQGVNYTVALDDIYELIYAQTTQIIPADVFYILLTDQNSQALRFVFCVEFDERISAKENQLITKTKTIESEIVQSGRGLLLNNYNGYCQKRDFAILYEGIQSAIVVPLNTGAITIGCILVAHRDPEKSFTEYQLNFVQSVADLVAGAIEKARLLQETDRYARQLSILNDLTRNLTSTFDIEELYETILKNSVDMIDCEEARLLIVDEKTQELVYKKVIGEQSEELFERRFPLDHGLAGQAYQSQNQVIIDQSHGQNEILQGIVFEKERPINSLMIIPMVLKNRVLGLIELINRRGDEIFNKNDQGLLSAFAAQSAIALENARLYYRTDQALAKRVEELSVMQLIDRELNTSLDIKRAMEITLSWALRQLDGNAGWIGQVIENKIQLMASQGYDTRILARISDETPLFTKFEQEKFFNNAQPLQIFPDQENRLHPLSKTQILVPIQRESKTIALMVLETLEEKPVDENDLNFLMRLSDHASIAIINSQLYGEVQAANQAKSEFVSLVAHELKNPMTSIKGYTELLVAGAAGTVNEAQTNFLTTIRSNTERMNTLVSDLNDLSKIEAGSMRLESKAIQLIDLINEIIRSTKRQTDEKQQKLHVKIPDDFPEIWGDSNRLLQILTNLVSNAHKYTQINGEISISAEITEDLSKREGGAKFAHIWVQDNGAGISEEDHGMVFQKFFRSENPKIRESSGAGLGLNITQSLVEMQGGKIWFESTLQKGTTFHFTIPLAQEENNP
ncbi:MAG: GAF domain-containing protein [Anaerolineaceae bacterium]|nr:GAF domain-containing protein [Anaerolineaceae bacterium]